MGFMAFLMALVCASHFVMGEEALVGAEDSLDPMSTTEMHRAFRREVQSARSTRRRLMRSWGKKSPKKAGKASKKKSPEQQFNTAKPSKKTEMILYGFIHALKRPSAVCPAKNRENIQNLIKLRTMGKVKRCFAAKVMGYDLKEVERGMALIQRI